MYNDKMIKLLADPQRLSSKADVAIITTQVAMNEASLRPTKV